MTWGERKARLDVCDDLAVAAMDLLGSLNPDEVAKKYGLNRDRAADIRRIVADERSSRAALRAALVDLTGDLTPSALCKRRPSISAARAREILDLACGVVSL